MEVIKPQIETWGNTAANREKNGAKCYLALDATGIVAFGNVDWKERQLVPYRYGSTWLIRSDEVQGILRVEIAGMRFERSQEIILGFGFVARTVQAPTAP